MHLAPHVDALLISIKQRALLAYFTPFASVSLSRMASAFGWREAATKTAVVDLIKRGLMKARIDQAKGVVVARRTEPRVEAFKNALEQGEKMQRKAAAVQLRCARASPTPAASPSRATTSLTLCLTSAQQDEAAPE